MNLEAIQEMWAKDSVIDDVMLDNASMKIPQLHAKYITLHSEFTLLLKKAKQEHQKSMAQPKAPPHTPIFPIHTSSSVCILPCVDLVQPSFFTSSACVLPIVLGRSTQTCGKVVSKGTQVITSTANEHSRQCAGLG